MRKTVFALFFFIICIIAGSFIGHKFRHLPNKQVVTGIQTIIPTPTITSTQILIPTPGIPERIIIPKIGINSVIESVGTDNEGRMDVPKVASDTAWYDLGFKPGSKGSAVIDGHLDKVTGAPAVFWNIAKLVIGDTITITDNTNKSYTFTITHKQIYPYNNLPLQEIFNSTDKARLNLITCNGNWDKVNKNYSNRIVIYSELKQ